MRRARGRVNLAQACIPCIKIREDLACPYFLLSAMSEQEDDEMCWNNLENFRVKLISVIDPSRITPYLRQCKVINHDDEEQVLNDPSLVVRKRKVGVLLDILQRTGQKGFEAFLESLELYYPQLYMKITGKEPSRVFSMIIDTAGESGLSQLLMNEITKLQSAVQEERRKAQELNMWLHAKEDALKEMRVRDSVLRKHQERAQKMKEERDNLAKELRKCKDENYDLAMSYAKQSEEKNAALMKNRDLQLEIDHLRHSLMKAEDDCTLERKHTMKLKHAIEKRPSHEVVWEIQREKELLLAKNQELENTLQVAKEGNLEKNSLYIQALEADRRRALGEHQELVNTIYSLRKALQQAEDLQDKHAEEKEVLELQCMSLRKDSRMYKDRIEAILKQIEEVAAERDQALLTREQFHMQYSKSLVDKDAYRKEIRELGERCDEMQLQLFQKEGQLLAAEAKLKKLHLEPPTLFQTSDLDDVSPRSSQELSFHGNLDEDTLLSDKKDLSEGQDQQFSALESIQCLQSSNEGGPPNGELAEKERRRMKDSFEHYRRSGLCSRDCSCHVCVTYWSLCVMSPAVPDPRRMRICYCLLF
ncbi:caspase recruitment domain-containing protein 9 isoform X3 [Malaclemys terrapin pileata]|uniref:caspase recruitment domain-containing protein 9 isoform X3 n=1 Tax=Malaclemys terrapin pileata TaxID=2991368 RepID=UPI0023A80799|nr:caspase recruitment domain-containing protein 9 isoform X3 [Malaclemys terrapin pileata]